MTNDATNPVEVMEPDTYAAPAHGWTCFHCGDTFTTPGSARDHFGFDPSADPACRIKIGAERGLVMALRKVENQLSELWHSVHNEGTEAAQAYYAQRNRHFNQLRCVEEEAYERGLTDGRTLNTRATDKTLAVELQSLAPITTDAIGNQFVSVPIALRDRILTSLEGQG